MGRATAKGLELPDLAHVTFPEEMYLEIVKDVRPLVEPGIDDIINALSKWKPAAAKPLATKPFVFKGTDYQNAVTRMNTFFVERHMSDGLPLIPPTKETVEWMLSGTDLSPDEVIARYEDLYRPITVRNIAINAAMAGARPEYMPVLIAAFKSMMKSNFQHLLFGSTSASAPMTIVNGPVARELNINSGVGLMGPGWQANASIGRAISLVLINGVGQIPGIEGPSLQSLPNRYTWCYAEREEANPWQPLHVERGFAPEVSTATVECAIGTRLFVTIWREPAQILSQIARIIESEVLAATAPPFNHILLLSPHDAETLAQGGWTKQDIRRYMYENARLPVWKVRSSGGAMLFHREKWETAFDDNTIIPSLRGPEYLVIVVAGGGGSHKSQFIPCYESGVTEEIDKYKPKEWEVLLRAAEREREREREEV